MKIITIANRKGGTGKSTVAYNLGFTYGLKGQKVLFIDLDSQGNLTNLCRQEPVPLDEFKSCSIKQINQLIDILPASKNFAMLEDEINRPEVIDRNAYLKDEILPKLQGYDYIIIDTPPALNFLNINAFCISDIVHIVINADTFSLMGLVEMRKILDGVKKINPKLKYHTTLNAYFTGRNMTSAVNDQLINQPDFTDIRIPHRQHIIDSNAKRQPSTDHEEIKAEFMKLAEVC